MKTTRKNWGLCQKNTFGFSSKINTALADGPSKHSIKCWHIELKTSMNWTSTSSSSCVMCGQTLTRCSGQLHSISGRWPMSLIVMYRPLNKEANQATIH